MVLFRGNRTGICICLDHLWQSGEEAGCRKISEVRQKKTPPLSGLYRNKGGEYLFNRL